MIQVEYAWAKTDCESWMKTFWRYEDGFLDKPDEVGAEPTKKTALTMTEIILRKNRYVENFNRRAMLSMSHAYVLQQNFEESTAK